MSFMTRAGAIGAARLQYMARRPPAFCPKRDQLGTLNIALGLVPTIALTDHAPLRMVVDALNRWGVDV